MITGKGVDEDWSKANPAQLKQLGYSFVVGYVSQDNTGKNLTIQDVKSIHNAGLSVALVYEYNPQSALGGYSQGVTDGSIARSHADTLGAPPDTALYAAVDFNVASGQMSVCLDYLKGFQHACALGEYRTGAYGGFPLCQYLQLNGYQGFLWQTYAWSNGHWLPGTAMHQYQNGVSIAGATVDLDESEIVDFGQWRNDMEQTDELVSPSNNPARAITVGDAMSDESNLRDWWVVGTSLNGPQVGSPADVIYKAAQMITSGKLTVGSIDYAQLAAAIVADSNFSQTVANAFIVALQTHPLEPKP